MATSIPKVNPLQAMTMAATQPLPEDPRMDRLIDRAMELINPSEDQTRRNELLAFAGGTSDDGGHGDFGSSMAGGYKAQSAARQKQAELQGTYLPHIMNALAAQQAMKQSAMVTQAMMGPGGGAWIDKVADKYNIAPEAIYADIASNQGKGVREMIYKNSTPEYKLQDGALVDINPVTNGMYDAVRGADGRPKMAPFQWTPGVTTSASGQSIGRMPNPNAPGGVSVFAPEGAADAIEANVRAQKQAENKETLETVTPRGGPPQLTTRDRAVQLARQGPYGGAAGMPGGGQDATGQFPVPTPSQARGNFTGDLSAIRKTIEGWPAGPDRDAALASLQNQVSGTNPPYQGPRAPSEIRGDQPMSLAQAKAEYAEAIEQKDEVRAARAKTMIDTLQGPQPQIGMALESPAEAKRQAEATETEGKNFAQNLKDLSNAKNSLKQYDKAIAILEAGTPTHSGIGAAVDKAAGLVGYGTKGAAANEDLKVIGKWLMSKVPRMEGPQSNFDVANYEAMAGRVGDETLPLNIRLAAAKAAKQMILDNAPKFFGDEKWKGATAQEDTAVPNAMPSINAIQAEIARRKGK